MYEICNVWRQLNFQMSFRNSFVCIQLNDLKCCNITIVLLTQWTRPPP